MDQFEEQVRSADGQQIIVGITAADLQKKKFPEPRWAIPGILTEGANLLAGKPKKGKSIFALNIGLSIAQGVLALGKISVEQGAVMYLALEDTPRRLQRRLRQMLSDPKEEPDCLHLFTKWPRMDAGGLELLEAKIAEIHGVRLVMIDTLQKFRKPTKGNVNLYSEDYEVVSKIKDVADRLGVCILLIHHLRKAESDDILDTLSGTLGLTGGTDSNLVMQSVGGNTILHIAGRDVEQTEYVLELDGQMLTWRLLGGREEVKNTNDQQRIYDALKEAAEALSPKELSEITGLKVGNIKRILGKFRDEGSVRCPAWGKYIYIYKDGYTGYY